MNGPSASTWMQASECVDKANVDLMRNVMVVCAAEMLEKGRAEWVYNTIIATHVRVTIVMEQVNQPNKET